MIDFLSAMFMPVVHWLADYVFGPIWDLLGAITFHSVIGVATLSVVILGAAVMVLARGRRAARRDGR